MAKTRLAILLFCLQDVDRPTSNPLPPQSEAFADHQNAQQALETVARQVPNFGTEQVCLLFQSIYLKFSICNYRYYTSFLVNMHVFNANMVIYVLIYGRIKLIVLSIWWLELVCLVRDAAKLIFTRINHALYSSRICIMLSFCYKWFSCWPCIICFSIVKIKHYLQRTLLYFSLDLCSRF